MNFTNVRILIVTALLIGSSYTFAQTQPDHGQVISEAQAKDDIALKKAVLVDNKICPVSKDAVAGSKMGDNPVLFEYNGKIYHLCCPMCIKDFKKNPKKFSKIAEDEVKVASK